MTANEAGKLLMNGLSQFRKLHVKSKPRHGLQPSERFTMFVIRQLTDNSPEGVKVTDISKALHVSPPTVTQRITSLEKKGFVNRSHSSKDRRIVLITISEKANDLFQSMKNEYLQMCIGLANHLGIDQSRQFAELLSNTYKFIQNYQEEKGNTEEC